LAFRALEFCAVTPTTVKGNRSKLPYDKHVWITGKRSTPQAKADYCDWACAEIRVVPGDKARPAAIRTPNKSK